MSPRPDSVELRLKNPDSTFINRLITLGIVPRHAYDADYDRHPIGSGPFDARFLGGRVSRLIVRRNPRYYGRQP